MRSIAIIPARGGSKRIPRKNIKDFLGQPIIAYSIASALASHVFDEVMVSTDDAEIAGISEKCGAKVPFFRSAELSNDRAMTAPVLVEVIKEYKKSGKRFDHVCCIYPCAPFIKEECLRQAMALLTEKRCDSVFPVVKFSYPPQRCLVIRDGKVLMLHPENYNVRSQDLEPYYHDVRQFYCVRTELLLATGKLIGDNSYPLIIPESEMQDIDTEEDWKIAEMKYRILNHV
ncbi:MAG TPA: pseudaminic acid cytidylyltransferase [Candidatus Omnitrophota bacterium]|mgnify:FL=1|nr:pseudaminic acid cytidylyltransferase [Candidatus Omnitrophota bacterium]